MESWANIIASARVIMSAILIKIALVMVYQHSQLTVVLIFITFQPLLTLLFNSNASDKHKMVICSQLLEIVLRIIKLSVWTIWPIALPIKIVPFWLSLLEQLSAVPPWMPQTLDIVLHFLLAIVNLYQEDIKHLKILPIMCLVTINNAHKLHNVDLHRLVLL